MFNEQSVENFLDSLAGQSATPGGGSVAALNGAMAAALVSMVCNLTIGRLKYADAEAEARAILDRSEALRAQLTTMISEDSAAFDQVMAAFRLPKETAEDKKARSEAIQTAFKAATLVPLATAQASAEILILCQSIIKIGNTNAISDGGVGALAARAGLKGAALNVLINLGSIKDKTFVTETESKLQEALAGKDQLAEEIYDTVKSQL